MNIKLAKAISLTIAGAALSVGTSSAFAGLTMYNTYNAYSVAEATDLNAKGTDGWVYGKAVAPNGVASPGFVGIGGSSTVSNSTPFGYAGGAPVNWAAQLTGGGDSVTISSADAYTRYGVYADIDAGAGAWGNNANHSNPTDPGSIAGWRHNTDYGLFESNVTTQVNLSAVGVSGVTANGTPILDPNNTFGFTIFQGMDTSTTAYSHHGSWNAGNNTAGLSAASLPGGGTTFTLSQIVAYSVGGANPQNISNISFTAQAGQVYTIVLGGYNNGSWGSTTEGYQLTIASVPVPGAVWLFGSAMAGLIGFGRRKLSASV